MPAFAADFLLDPTRAVYQLVANGCLRHHPQLRIILSHAEGFLPMQAIAWPSPLRESSAPGWKNLDIFRSFYFDTALSASPAALPSLLAFARPDHILFGTEWPFTLEEAVGYFTASLDAYWALDESARRALDRDNASLLFPAFA